MTLMLGMIDGYYHLFFTDIAAGPVLGAISREEHTLMTMHNARTVPDAGFIGAYGAASVKVRLDVVIREEIEARRIPGPRLRAASPEITVSVSLGDANLLHMPRDSFGVVANGVDEITRAVRLCVREGVDNIKINMSGQEAFDALESVKDRIFGAPAIGLQHTALHDVEPWGITTEMAEACGVRRSIERSLETHAAMRTRGIRAAIRGDYGFAWNPQGANARDIEHFVNYFGFSPSEALQAATRVGG